MSNIIVNEDKRPMFVCPHCKKKQIVDIRSWNADMSKLAVLTCQSCRKQVYAGILLLVHPSQYGLIEAIMKVTNAVGKKNTLEL